MAETSALAFLLILLFPLAATQLAKLPLVRGVGPAVLCYLLGIGMGALGLRLPTADTEELVGASILLALPLLLMGADVRAWLRYGKDTWLAFLAAAVAVFVATALLGRLLTGPAQDWAPMLAAVYLGGTPNLAAVGWSLGAPATDITLLHATDAVCSALFLLFLMRLARPLLLRWLPHKSNMYAAVAPLPPPPAVLSLPSLLAFVVALVLALLAYLGAQHLQHHFPLAPEASGSVFFALLVSLVGVLGILASLVPPVRKLGSAATPLGEYAVLVFCVAFGTLTQPQVLLQSSPQALGFTAAVLLGSATLYFVLCRMLRIDRDTAIIVSCATTQGPAFVSPVAYALQRPQLLLPGVAVGLAGYALGTWLGLLLAALL